MVPEFNFLVLMVVVWLCKRKLLFLGNSYHRKTLIVIYIFFFCLLSYFTAFFSPFNSLLYKLTVMILLRTDPWRRKWQPILVFLPGKPQGQRSLWATVRGITTVGLDLVTKSHGLNCILPKFIPWGPKPQYLTTRLYSGTGCLRR